MTVLNDTASLIPSVPRSARKPVGHTFHMDRIFRFDDGYINNVEPKLFFMSFIYIYMYKVLDIHISKLNTPLKEEV